MQFGWAANTVGIHQMWFSLMLVLPLALVSTHRNHRLIARTRAHSVSSTGSTHPHVDLSLPMAKLSKLAQIVVIAGSHQHADIAPPVTSSTKEAQRAENALKGRSQMMTVPLVLTRSHALLALTAAVTVPQVTLTSPTGAIATVLVVFWELIAAHRLHVTQLLTAVVMAPRLMSTAPMAVTVPAMKGLKEQIAQLPQSKAVYPQSALSSTRR